jgi:hypothetical protein
MNHNGLGDFVFCGTIIILIWWRWPRPLQMKIIAIIGAVVFAVSLWSFQSVAGEDLDRLDIVASYCLGVVAMELREVEALMKGMHPGNPHYDVAQQASARLNKLRNDLIMYLDVRKYDFGPVLLKAHGDFKACNAAIDAQFNQCKQMCDGQPDPTICMAKRKCFVPDRPPPICAKIQACRSIFAVGHD